MATTASKKLNETLSGDWIGNGPYVKCQYGTIYCTVDFNDDRPFAVKCDLDQKVSLKGVGGFRGSDAGFYCLSLNGVDHAAIGGQIQWGLKNKNVAGTKSSDSGWVRKNSVIMDIRDILGNNFTSHTWYPVTAKWRYWYTGYAYIPIRGWDIVNHYNTEYTTTVQIYTPRVVGGNRKNWWGNASQGSSYAYRSVRFTANYGGLTVGNEAHTVQFYVGGTLIGSQTNRTNGTISGNKYIGGTGSQYWYIICDGHKINQGYFNFVEPPPAKPTMSNVNNTTLTSINTTQTKTISANWYRGDVGWPQGTVTYNWECYYGSTLIKSGETTDTSTSFTYNIPSQHTGADIYFRVRARQNSNNLGYSGWMDSGRVTIFWAYNEPSKVQAGSSSPNRFQLFHGNKTGITTNASMRIGGWGDRPGTRNVEFRMHNATRNQHVAWYGRNNTSDTGTYSQSLTATIPDANVNDIYEVWAHKRLGDTEYLASSDARYPAIGTNNVKVGNITFYEVKGKITGSFNIDPNIIISGLSSAINYEFRYDKQSSAKVDVYLEVYDISNKKVTKTFKFEQGVNESKTIQNRRTDLVLIEAQKAGAYEVRLKADITELLGGVTTHTLAAIEPENYNPPIPRISINNLSKPLPTTNAASLLGKQDTDITWNYNYSFEGVQIKSAEIEVVSKPYGKQIFVVPSSTTGSPYYNKYTRKSTGEFDLGSQVTAFLRVYYAIYGDNRIWTVESEKLTVNITHTRYMFYYTNTNIGEKQMIQMRWLNDRNDQVLKKIHIDS